MTAFRKGRFGLRATCLTFWETIAQSVANISPTFTPVVIIPLVFASAGSGTWLAYLFACAGLVLVGANVNQFASRSATPGSLFAYVGRGLGLPLGFLAGWALLIAYVLTGTAVLAGGVSYAGMLLNAVHLYTPPVVLFAVGAALAGGVAYHDVKLSTRMMLVFELASMALILLVGVLVMISRHSAYDATQFDFAHMDVAGVKAGLILAIFSYVGFESATTLGEEAQLPLRNIPRSVILSSIISGLFFMMTAYMAVLGFHAMSGSLGTSSAPFSELAADVHMPFFGVLISLGAVISMFACTLASVNAGSRILFMMSRYGIFHRRLGTSHPINDTPHVAISFSSAIIFVVAAVLLLAGLSVADIFNAMSTIATYGFLLVYVLISIAAPCYLARRGELGLQGIALAVASLLFMAAPMIATVDPWPAAPSDRLPVYFLMYVLLGGAWYLWVHWRTTDQTRAQLRAELQKE